MQPASDAVGGLGKPWAFIVVAVGYINHRGNLSQPLARNKNITPSTLTTTHPHFFFLSSSLSFSSANKLPPAVEHLRLRSQGRPAKARRPTPDDRQVNSQLTKSQRKSRTHQCPAIRRRHSLSMLSLLCPAQPKPLSRTSFNSTPPKSRPDERTRAACAGTSTARAARERVVIAASTRQRQHGMHAADIQAGRAQQRAAVHGSHRPRRTGALN